MTTPCVHADAELDLHAAVPLDCLAYRFDLVLRGHRATLFLKIALRGPPDEREPARNRLADGGTLCSYRPGADARRLSYF